MIGIHNTITNKDKFLINLPDKFSIEDALKNRLNSKAIHENINLIFLFLNTFFSPEHPKYGEVKIIHQKILNQIIASRTMKLEKILLRKLSADADFSNNTILADLSNELLDCIKSENSDDLYYWINKILMINIFDNRFTGKLSKKSQKSNRKDQLNNDKIRSFGPFIEWVITLPQTLNYDCLNSMSKCDEELLARYEGLMRSPLVLHHPSKRFYKLNELPPTIRLEDCTTQSLDDWLKIEHKDAPFYQLQHILNESHTDLFKIFSLKFDPLVKDIMDSGFDWKILKNITDEDIAIKNRLMGIEILSEEEYPHLKDIQAFEMMYEKFS